MALYFLFWSSRQSGGLIISGQEVGCVLGQLGDCNQAGKVSKIRTFVVELDEAVVLGVISLP